MGFQTTAPHWKEQEEVATALLQADVHNLIVWNDEVNTFEHVIASLVDVCDHTEEQAEQCALFIHYRGKYAVRKGAFDELRPRCEALIDRGINATIG